MEPDRIYELATAVKQAVIDHYADEAASGIARGDDAELPERRYVAEGIPAWDCPFMCVQVERMFGGPGPANQGATSFETTGTLRSATMAIWIVRWATSYRADTGARTPPTDELEASAALVLADPVHVLRAIKTARAEGKLPSTHGLVWEETIPAGPEDEMVGTVTRVTLRLTRF